MKTLCIYHSRDLDGWMSAAIVKKWFIDSNPNEKIINGLPVEDYGEISAYDEYTPELIFLGYDYGDPIPDCSGYDKVIMCDVSFRYEEMVHLGAELVWIDHHKSAMEVVEKGLKCDSGHIDGLRDVNFAACELTWKYFFPEETMPEIVRLLGRYDCFGHKGTDEEQKVLEFQYGARACMSNYEDCYRELDNTIDNPVGINMIHQQGIGIYNYLRTEAKQTYSKSFPVEFNEQFIDEKEGSTSFEKHRKFLCVNQERFNPINFGIDYHKEGYDGFACFWYKDGKWMFSLYNDNGEVDCSAICKQYGGGGHRGAAGMVTENLESIIKQ